MVNGGKIADNDRRLADGSPFNVAGLGRKFCLLTANIQKMIRITS
jgi:hypothetical protein